MILSDQSSFDFITLADFVVQFLAVAYGVLATATDFKETTAEGKKHLSKTGKIGIAFLLVISIASIGVKIYQNAKDSKTKAEAQAAQQKIIQDLEQSLSNSRDMSNALDDANTKLTHETDILKQQTEKMSDLTEGSQKIIHATNRVLDPLDESFHIYVRERLKSGEPALQTYLRRIGSPKYMYPESEESRDWPKAQDGDFGIYANHRTIFVEVYPISELRQVIHPKPNAVHSGYQLQAEVVCATPDQGYSSQVTVEVHFDEIILECRAHDVTWRRYGDTKSYVDLTNSFWTVELSTIVLNHVGDPQSYAPPLEYLDVDIIGRNHTLDSGKFYEFPCPSGHKLTCYISHMPRI